MSEDAVTVEIVRENLPAWKGQAHLVKASTGDHFVVSGVTAMYSGWEVLVFKSDENGKVDDYVEVAGGRDITHEEAIADLVVLLREGVSA